MPDQGTPFRFSSSSAGKATSTGNGFAEGLLKSLLSDQALRKKHKQSLRRINVACDALERAGRCIEVRAVAHQIRLRYGRRASPTEKGIARNKSTLLRYIRHRQQEQIQASVQHYSHDHRT